MENLTRQEKINKMMAARHQGIVVLEDIHDPHNAAAVWRSADAFGFGKIYLIFEQEAKFNPKKVGKETSGSANKWLDFEIFSSAEECFQKLKEQGYKIYATVLDREAKILNEIKFENKTAIVLGNEHRGLSEEAIKMADEKIYIPMLGMVQSLNLSVTAGICMWEYTQSL
jgi:tRNA (guanosine-2'-O-)-methyltransferase